MLCLVFGSLFFLQNSSLKLQCKCNAVCEGAVVSWLDVRSEVRWFDTQSLPSSCFLRQETLPHIGSLHPSVLNGKPATYCWG